MNFRNISKTMLQSIFRFLGVIALSVLLLTMQFSVFELCPFPDTEQEHQFSVSASTTSTSGSSCQSSWCDSEPTTDQDSSDDFDHETCKTCGPICCNGEPCGHSSCLTEVLGDSSKDNICMSAQKFSPRYEPKGIFRPPVALS